MRRWGTLVMVLAAALGLWPAAAPAASGVPQQAAAQAVPPAQAPAAPSPAAPGQPAAQAGAPAGPAPQSAAGGQAALPAPVPEAPAPAATYSYVPGGRRDPFLSLVARGDGGRADGQRAEGLPGLMVAEIALKGIIKGRDGCLAIVQGPDTRSFIAHAGDKLADGLVKSVTPEILVLLQEVNDPLQLTKQREVKLTLPRVLQEVK